MEKVYTIKMAETGIIIKSTGLTDIEKLGLLEFSILRLKQNMCQYSKEEHGTGDPPENLEEPEMDRQGTGGEG